MITLERRGRDLARWAASDVGAKWAFRLMLVITVVVFYIVGRHQWFTRDDWAFVLTRERILQFHGWQDWLFLPQDGHWLTIPIVLYHWIQELFGLTSYWPFLLPAMVAHVGAVLLARNVCRRLHVSAWTTTIVCSMLLVFGSGFDNIVFAIQVCYNLSLVCFLAQLLLVDHDGPVDWRDGVGSALGVLAMLTSGFGPIFMVGVFALLFLRRRWLALAIAVVPQGLAYGWWLLIWAADPVADRRPGDKALLPAYLARGVSATFDGMLILPGLAGLAIVATVAMSLWTGLAWSARSLMLSLWTTVIVMFVAIGWERIGFGVPSAASTRYVHVAAIVIAPAFALTVDQLVKVSERARWAARLVLLLAVGVNAGALRSEGAHWAIASRDEKDLFELVAGSAEVASAAPTQVLSERSPDVTVMLVPTLVADEAITPRQAVTDEERARVRAALGLSP